MNTVSHIPQRQSYVWAVISDCIRRIVGHDEPISTGCFIYGLYCAFVVIGLQVLGAVPVAEPFTLWTSIRSGVLAYTIILGASTAGRVPRPREAAWRIYATLPIGVKKLGAILWFEAVLLFPILIAAPVLVGVTLEGVVPWAKIPMSTSDGVRFMLLCVGWSALFLTADALRTVLTARCPRFKYVWSICISPFVVLYVLWLCGAFTFSQFVTVLNAPMSLLVAVVATLLAVSFCVSRWIDLASHMRESLKTSTTATTNTRPSRFLRSRFLGLSYPWWQVSSRFLVYPAAALFLYVSLAIFSQVHRPLARPDSESDRFAVTCFAFILICVPAILSVVVWSTLQSQLRTLRALPLSATAQTLVFLSLPVTGYAAGVVGIEALLLVMGLGIVTTAVVSWACVLAGISCIYGYYSMTIEPLSMVIVLILLCVLVLPVIGIVLAGLDDAYSLAVCLCAACLLIQFTYKRLYRLITTSSVVYRNVNTQTGQEYGA